MASNHPNMSHCMFENTLQAMEQIQEALRGEHSDFFSDMSKEEKQSARRLASVCAVYLDEYEDYLEPILDGNSS